MRYLVFREIDVPAGQEFNLGGRITEPGAYLLPNGSGVIAYWPPSTPPGDERMLMFYHIALEALRDRLHTTSPAQEGGRVDVHLLLDQLLELRGAPLPGTPPRARDGVARA